MPRMNEPEKLSTEDVKMLTQQGNLETKVKVVDKISGQYATKGFSDKEKGLAEEIFRLLIKYAEVGVRKSLAENLMNTDEVPRDVLLTLAKDIDDVSRPILEFSQILTDDDLVEIIKTSNSTEKQIAIARREGLSENVSGALVEVNNEDVISNLLQNATAQINEKDYLTIVDTHANKEDIIESLITRGSIPSHVVVSVTKKVSEAIRSKLETKYSCNFDKINSLFKDSGEIAAFRFGNMKIFGEDLIELINMLESNNQLEQALEPIHGKLTFILNDFEPIGQFVPISAIALGNKTMFEICMARLAGVKFSNIRKLVTDLDHGLKALYDRAHLPDALFEAVRFSIWVINQMDIESEKFGTPKAKDDLHEYIKKIISLSRGKKIKNLSSFISIIKKHIDRQDGEW
ncbi:MAG: DUF2336 domain-containing protein [Rickettsiales bacterium]|nr:DUF2336 domain-containing protein [Rickettsiales bacterium]